MKIFCFHKDFQLINWREEALGSREEKLALNRWSMARFPGGLEVKIPGFHCHGLGSIPGQGTDPASLAGRQNI